MVKNLIIFLALISGTGVIISIRPILSLIFLILLFVTTACSLIVGGITYIGLVYIIVYVGAIAILFLFVVIILNLNSIEHYRKNTNSFPLGALLLGGFIYIYYSLYNFTNGSLLATFSLFQPQSLIINIFYIDPLIVQYNSPIINIGSSIFSHIAIISIILSWILLLSIFGPISISLDKRPYIKL